MEVTMTNTNQILASHKTEQSEIEHGQARAQDKGGSFL